MSTSTGGNGARGGAAGIQLPSMDWEMEEEGAPAGAPPASAPSGTDPVTAEAPTEQVAVPEYGPVTPAEPGPGTGAVLPGPVPVPDPGYGPGEEPGALEPVSVEAGHPDGGDPGEPPARRRFKRPALVAAATAGVVLMGLPFLITDGPDGAKEKKGDGRGVNQADHQLVDGPEIGELPVPPAPVDPPVTGAPTAAPTDPAVTGEIPGTAATAPADGTGTVPGLALGGGTAGVPVNPGTQPGTQSGGGTGPAAKAPVNGAPQQPNSGGKTVQQPAAGQQPAPQQPVPQQPQQPAPQQPAPQQPAPQQPAPQQPAPQQPAPQQPAPQPSAPQQPAPPPAAAKATYSAIGGSNCGTSSVAYAQNGWWEQGSAGWTTNSAGGYSGSGCNGKYVSMPMSGSATKDDNTNSVVWTFSTAPVTTGTCKISVYVPNNTDPKAVGGSPAYYTVQNSSTPNSGTIGDFSVNQTTSRGSWVTAEKTFAVGGGKIAVMLHSRGLDWGNSATDKAHLAASAVRADCTAS
ncbi:hypothetical protein ACFVVU_28080 [Kitasatospora sp. NPDC057965]|uniref:hypothetical protein n=1 Tax=Kitasatospora sp. NPDC057965 TaxID=3346291 RepID=UPI0036D78AF1